MRHTVLTGAQFSLKVDVFGIQVEFRALEIREVDPQVTKGERRCSCSSTAVANRTEQTALATPVRCKDKNSP